MTKDDFIKNYGYMMVRLVEEDKSILWFRNATVIIAVLFVPYNYTPENIITLMDFNFIPDNIIAGVDPRGCYIFNETYTPYLEEKHKGFKKEK